MYVASLGPVSASRDPWTVWLAEHHIVVAVYLIFLAMVFDALDGRLARFTRHTTDFGGQLDSLADAISFGAAPAFIALHVMKANFPEIPPMLSRLIAALAVLYAACALLRLARFNVSNEHGEQHHFSFLGLPSPGAGGAVAAWILMQQHLAGPGWGAGIETFVHFLSRVCLYLLPLLVAGMGLLMVSNIRYPHLVNRYLRGKRSIGRLLLVLGLVLAVVTWHEITIGLGALAYALSGPISWLYARTRTSLPHSAPTP
jgi:CDP-diacylglycerol---serine O-phosphatidyltransferase